MRASNIHPWIKVSSLVAVVALISACAAPEQERAPCRILQQSSACVAVPVHDDVHEDEAKKLTPPPEGMAYLYITRPYAQQRGARTRVYVDDRLVAELRPMSFARIAVRPGRHTVRVVTDKVEAVSMATDTEKVTFLEYQVVEHFFSTEPSLKSVARERASESMQPLEMVLNADQQGAH
ncbi:DUF2846 domain-containing protein [Herbaspirillum sp. WGmk3]|uniref:DUF2846 domain-containing protein n=1 Tax=Herbaspirillum sp. WGmk3 TaxID=2919925 RepID=UPI0020913E56|nr:DUF2846 domain-containing protein [Herbaspirillum sp. WGmk3]MCO4857636.1 DUF2846 domain-containing protein [Herbaspirillum sp. WGmk3]